MNLRSLSPHARAEQATRDLMKQYGYTDQFKPFAYLDPYLGWIFYVKYDCSFTESNLSTGVALLSANYAPAERQFCGFILRNGRFLVERFSTVVNSQPTHLAQILTVAEHSMPGERSAIIRLDELFAVDLYTDRTGLKQFPPTLV